MFKVTVNGKKGFSVSDPNGKMLVDGTKIDFDLVKISETEWHILKDIKSYNIKVMSIDYAAKTFQVLINNNKYSLTVKDKYDILLHEMGMDNLISIKTSDIKAPMPGLVVNLMVTEGQLVKKDDAILVLEAMKMENILKSPCNGLIKRINVEIKEKVEKNQVLIMFDV